MVIEIPTPDTVLMEAMYDDPLADDILQRWNILGMIKAYSGQAVKTTLKNVAYFSDEGEGKERVPADRGIDLANRKLHQFGWHLSFTFGSYESYFLLDSWSPPPVAKLRFMERLRKALRILAGEEE